jgi:bifunctional non-homologous end joining protein LigD
VALAFLRGKDAARRKEDVLTHRLLEVDGHTIAVTDPERRLDGDRGPSKAEVLAYYIKVAPRLLPYVRGRPVSTTLLPDDSTQEFRFARTAPLRCPRRFATCRLGGIDRPQLERYLTVPDVGTLAALVDYGCLSFHPWNSTTDLPLQPTQMVFNLDPEAIAFREVRQAALLLRELLSDFGLRAWVKTSGRSGLHVLVPFHGRVSFDDVRSVADMIVNRATRRDPKLFSRDPRRSRRRGRILLDTSRNERGRTIIAPYAVATSGFVSTPLEWDELRRPTYPDEFGMEQVLARAATDFTNDEGFFAIAQSLKLVLRDMHQRRSPVRSRADSERLSRNAPPTVSNGRSGAAL